MVPGPDMKSGCANHDTSITKCNMCEMLLQIECVRYNEPKRKFNFTSIKCVEQLSQGKCLKGNNVLNVSIKDALVLFIACIHICIVNAAAPCSSPF